MNLKLEPSNAVAGLPTYIFALGGLEEVGKNCYCVEYNDELVMLDAGMKLSNDHASGKFIIIPDFQYLLSSHLKKRTLLITHGHEDHIGAIVHLLQTVHFDEIYAPKLTIELIKYKFKQVNFVSPSQIKQVKNGSEIKTKYFTCHFFAQNHSIPDSYGIAIKTPNGTVVTTGDFKFDFSPLDHSCDIHYMAEIGKEGVDLLLSDSTNSLVPGATRSESEILLDIESIFLKTKKRLIFSTFASNVYRINRVLGLAAKYNRKVCLMGRSMIRVVEVALQSGYLDVPTDLFVDPKDINSVPLEKLLVLCTGSQGEPMAALTRMADQTHNFLQVIPGDTIIFSSNPIPGNFLNVEVVVNMLTKLGATVLENKAFNLLHTSGHASVDEQKLMLTLMQPKYFMPMHGHYEMLRAHKLSAIKTGVKRENIFILANGERLELINGTCKISKTVAHTDSIYVDSDNAIGLHNAVINERKMLAHQGVLAVVVHLKNGQVASKPRILTKGLVFIKESRYFLNQCSNIVLNTMNEMLAKKNADFNDFKLAIKNALYSYVFKKTHSHPVYVPVIMAEKTFMAASSK